MKRDLFEFQRKGCDHIIKSLYACTYRLADRGGRHVHQGGVARVRGGRLQRTLHRLVHAEEDGRCHFLGEDV